MMGFPGFLRRHCELRLICYAPMTRRFAVHPCLIAALLAVSGSNAVSASTCPHAADEPATAPPLATAQRQQVGDVVGVRAIETTHPYRFDAGDTPRLLQQLELHLPGATYVAPYFSRFDLAEGDHVIVRSPDGSRRWRYEGQGKPGLRRGDGFWGIHVPGERLIVELHGSGRGEGWGFRIDKAARGFALPGQRVICGADDKRNASCYRHSHPQQYASAGAVTRLLINGTSFCTGWLLGSEGHVITNNHCIGSAADALNTTFEFMVEAPCEDSCTTWMCPGTIVATQSTLVQTSSGLPDFSLLKLPVNPAQTYGYLRLRNGAPQLGEAIYLPQHPDGRGKEIAMTSSHPADPDGLPRIQHLANPFARYFADTEGGSSGSPVIARADNCVVMLHAGSYGCEDTHYTGNVGVRSDRLIAELGQNVPADALCGGDALFANGFQ